MPTTPTTLTFTEHDTAHAIKVIDHALEYTRDQLKSTPLTPDDKYELKQNLVDLLRTRGDLVYASDRTAAEAAYFLAGALELTLNVTQQNGE